MRKKLTNEEFIDRLHKINSNIKPIGIYVRSDIPVECECLLDGHKWSPLPAELFRGKGCPVCAGNIKRTHEQYILDINAIHPNIEVVGEYINLKTDILHKCKIDGYIWSAKPNNVLRGTGCPMCVGLVHKTHEQYVSEVLNITTDIEVIEEYKNRYIPILHRCKICGNVWPARPYNILFGHSCPKCNKSQGEKNVEKFLDEHQIYYIPQYSFNECRYKSVLFFDFYLPEFNTCIEFDGIQHFEPLDFFGGEEMFKIRQQCDLIKTNYCKDNNILLLRIKYDQDINLILTTFFDNINNAK